MKFEEKEKSFDPEYKGQPNPTKVTKGQPNPLQILQKFNARKTKECSR